MSGYALKLNSNMKNYNFKNKIVLVTGGTGSLGTALVQKLLDEKIKEVRVYSRDEYKQSEMMRHIEDKRVTYWLGDICNLERLKEACEDVDIILHTAAMKRMDSVSHNASVVADVNINGTKNVMLAGRNCERVVFVSSDKAYSPTNLYGATKRVAEDIVLACKNGVVFRFGNFMWSRGSVWEVFDEQKYSGVLTITDPDATRFVITIDDVCKHVMSDVCPGGAYFPHDLKSKKVIDIASEVAPEVKKYDFIGLRPGEKLHEAFEEGYSSDKCL